MFIRFDMIHERDRQTDQTDTAWQLEPRLCISSRGKSRDFRPNLALALII